jgi:hypothetical protein
LGIKYLRIIDHGEVETETQVARETAVLVPN